MGLVVDEFTKDEHWVKGWDALLITKW